MARRLPVLTDPVRFSHLKRMAQSPLHYRHSVEEQREDARHLRLGRTLHCILMGGKELAVYPGAVRRGKEWDKFAAAHVGCEIILAADYEVAEAMAGEVQKNRDAMDLLTGIKEKRIEWTYLGRRCAGTPDAHADAIVELKTGRTSEPGRFVRDGIWYGYHAQLWWYRNGVISSGVGKPQSAYVVAVESSPPYPVTVLRLTQRALDQGERLCRLWMERLLACEAAGEWPGYVQGIVDFDVPEDDLGLVFADDEEAA
jgi:hypothetical protein